MLFSGEYECRLDAKGRLLMPARLRARLPERSPALFVMRGFEPCLVVYPEAHWQSIHNRVSALSEFSPEARAFQRSFLRGTIETELDAQGRLLLPKTMTTYAHLEDGQVLVVGVANRIEIWQPAQYQQHLTSDMAALSREAERILGPGNGTPPLSL